MPNNNLFSFQIKTIKLLNHAHQITIKPCKGNHQFKTIAHTKLSAHRIAWKYMQAFFTTKQQANSYKIIENHVPPISTLLPKNPSLNLHSKHSLPHSNRQTVIRSLKIMYLQSIHCYFKTLPWTYIMMSFTELKENKSTVKQKKQLI